MCSRMCQVQRVPLRVGDTVEAIGPDGARFTARWQGFARGETIQKWLDGGWTLCTIQVTDFAERNRRTGQNVWAGKPAVVQGIHLNGRVSVVTRESTPAERDYYGHHRVPLEIGEL